MMARLKNTEDEKYLKDCFLCYKQFKDPRILECFHTFCCYCLAEFIRDSVSDDAIECPLCGFETPLPEDGAKGFPRNCYIGLKPKRKPQCDVCGDVTTADTFCFECDQNICPFCLNFHGKLPASQDHRVTRINRDGSSKVTKTAMCPKHKKEEMKYFCEDCMELICTECNMTSHKKHDSKDIKTTAGRFRARLTSALNDDEYEDFITELNEEKDNLRKKKNIDKDHEEDLLDAIQERSKLLHEKIDEIRDDVIGKLVHNGEKNKKEFTNNIKLSEKRIHSFAALFHFSKRVLEQADDTEIATNAMKLENRLFDIKAEGKLDDPRVGKCFFEEGTIDSDVLSEMFGKVIMPNRNETSRNLSVSFPCRQNYVISGIAPIFEDMAWVSLGTEGLLGLYDTNGKCKKSVSLNQAVDDLTALNKETVFASTNSGKKIIKVTNGKSKTFYRSTMCTRGVQYDTRTDKIFVTLTTRDTFFNTRGGDKSEVIAIKDAGDSRPDIITEKPIYPSRITVLTNGGFVISDWIACAVIFFNKRGKRLSEYRGRDKSEEDSFCPRGLCCDSNNNVYVIDHEKDCIHKLDVEGNFRRIVSLDKKVNQIWSVACDLNDKLWIGTQTGRIHVVEL